MGFIALCMHSQLASVTRRFIVKDMERAHLFTERGLRILRGGGPSNLWHPCIHPPSHTPRLPLSSEKQTYGRENTENRCLLSLDPPDLSGSSDKLPSSSIFWPFTVGSARWSPSHEAHAHSHKPQATASVPPISLDCRQKVTQSGEVGDSKGMVGSRPRHWRYETVLLILHLLWHTDQCICALTGAVILPFCQYERQSMFWDGF